ncbi:MAG: DUF3581 family protein [Gammaproteobacteria bacterium]|nr:DUF3581 family protein [Gammaproteobacteria bacterium]
MNLAQYYCQNDRTFSFSRQQASDFAKQIAGDFNPLHDVETKKFCVPGDLLFSLALDKLGVSKQMNFTFCGMVSDNLELDYNDKAAEQLSIIDSADKEYLKIDRSGELSGDSQLANSLAQRYVEFSGDTFPNILLPLMEQNNVMINPARPLVIYESMSISLNRLDFINPSLEVTHTELEVNGKRGRAILQFCFKVGDEVVGQGEKRMALSGLREFDAEIMTKVVADYQARKAGYNQ